MDIYQNALQDVFTESGFTGFSILPEDNPDKTYEVVSTIGLTGELKGYLVLRTSLESARAFAVSLASIMGMMTPETENEPFGTFHKEVLSEITNQVAGRAIMLLSKEGLDCNITLPTILVGSSIYTNMINFDQFSSCRISGGFGEIALFVGLKTAKI